MGVFFITGIHGVGKTTLCNQFKTQSKIHFFSASQLIKSMRPDSLDSSSKNVHDIDNNQTILLHAIESKLLNFPVIVLDGHSTLFNSHGEIKRLPVSVFEPMQLRAICCVYEQPAIITERLLARDNRTYDVSFIKQHQEIELAHSADIANHLGIPFQTVTSSQSDIFIKTLNSWT